MSDFLKHDAPEFQPGCEWVAADNSGYRVEIVGVTPWPKAGSWCEYDVNYRHVNVMLTRDIFHFQVRYKPVATGSGS